jgi:hypothetical protein
VCVASIFNIQTVHYQLLLPLSLVMYLDVIRSLSLWMHDLCTAYKNQLWSLFHWGLLHIPTPSQSTRSWDCTGQWLGSGLNDRGIAFRLPGQEMLAPFLHIVQIGSEAHPPSYSMSTNVTLSTWLNRPGCEPDHSPRCRRDVICYHGVHKHVTFDLHIYKTTRSRACKIE